METITIGKLIKEEVKRQGMSIEEFCEKLNFQASNAHKIFKKNNLDLVMLGRISEALNRDFFKEISDNPELLHLHDEETLAYLEERRAVSQFMEVMPRVLKRMEAVPVISFGNKELFEDSFPVPDFILPGYNITFTKGETLRERAQLYSAENLRIEHIFDKKGNEFDVWLDLRNNEILIMDIKLIYRTEEEWFNLMCYIFGYLFRDGFREDKTEDFLEKDKTLKAIKR